MTVAPMRVIEVHDADLDWLHAEIVMLDECIRQTLDARKRHGQSPDCNAVRTLTDLRDRYDRIAKRIAPKATLHS